MRTALLTTGAATLTFCLAACGSNSTTAAPSRASASTSAAAAKPSPGVDCSNTSLSQADWTANCSSPGSQQVPSTVAQQMLQLGQSASTAGDPHPIDGPGGGVLEITPTSVIYLKKTHFDEVPSNGRFVVITMKVRPMTAAPAAEMAPANGGGWTYIAPDGQAIGFGDGTSMGAPQGFNGGGVIEPGTYQWDSESFDIDPSQVGGALMYKDGDGNTYRWKLPATDQGPQVAKVKKSE